MIENAKIKDTFVGTIDGVTRVFGVRLQGDGWDQTCTYTLYPNAPIDILFDLADTFECSSYEAVRGKYCRVERNETLNKVIRIGNLLKDKWFSFAPSSAPTNNLKENQQQ